MNKQRIIRRTSALISAASIGFLASCSSKPHPEFITLTKAKPHLAKADNNYIFVPQGVKATIDHASRSIIFVEKGASLKGFTHSSKQTKVIRDVGASVTLSNIEPNRSIVSHKTRVKTYYQKLKGDSDIPKVSAPETNATPDPRLMHAARKPKKRSFLDSLLSSLLGSSGSSGDTGDSYGPSSDEASQIRSKLRKSY